MQTTAQAAAPAKQHPSRSAPRCTDCLHSMQRADSRPLSCNHPATSVDPVSGEPLLNALAMRAHRTNGDAASALSELYCGPRGLLFKPKSGATPPADKPLRFHVRAVDSSGKRTEYNAIGGSSCGHTADAISLAGLGGRVSVAPLRSADLSGSHTARTSAPRQS
jgi:hypothetical protein